MCKHDGAACRHNQCKLFQITPEEKLHSRIPLTHGTWQVATFILIQESRCRGRFIMICKNHMCTQWSAGRGGSNFILKCTSGLELRGRARLNNSAQNRSWTWRTIIYADFCSHACRGMHGCTGLKSMTPPAWILAREFSFTRPLFFFFSEEAGWYLLDKWQSAEQRRAAVQQWSSNDPRGFRSRRHSDRASISGTHRNIKCTKEHSHTHALAESIENVKKKFPPTIKWAFAGIKTALWLWGWCDDLGLCQEKREEADAEVFTGKLRWSSEVHPFFFFLASSAFYYFAICIST